MAKKEPKKRGAKTKYETLRVAEKLDSVRGWAMHGGYEAVADALGVAKSTVSAWTGKYPEFKDAMSRGKVESDGEILVSAFDQARGYFRTVKEPIKLRKQTVDTVSGKILVNEEVQIVEYEKFFPADPRMTQFMTTNRFRAEYQKTPEPPEEKVDRTIEFAFESAGGEDYSK